MSKEFAIGTHVRYGGTGVCRVDHVEKVPFPNQQAMRLCYALQPLRSPGMVIYVPLDNEKLLEKMRALPTKTEVDCLLFQAKSNTMQWIDDRKERTTAFRRILSGGDEQSLIRLMCCIDCRRVTLAPTGKKLSAADDMAWKDAARMLEEEFALALDCDPARVAAYVKAKLAANA